MEKATLDDFMSLNDQLAAAVEAGVPLDVDLGRGKKETAITLEKINALVARRVSQGSSLSAAIANDDAVITPGYRSLMQLGLSSGDFSKGLDLSNRLGQTVNRAGYTGWLALFYPVIVCCVALVGLVGFCLFFLPVMEATHRGLAVPSGQGLRVLQVLRETLPYWACALPVGLIIAAGWARSRSKNQTSRAGAGPLAWVSGVSRTVSLERAANFAEAMATLLQNDIPLPEAMRVAADTWNAKPLADATRALAGRLAQGQANHRQANHGQASIDDSQLAAIFPPFLRWSLLHSESTIGRVRALQMAAELYRREAEHRQERLRVVAPLVLTVVIGGGATLLYGLALFVPVVEMLRALRPEDGRDFFMPQFRYQALNADEQLVAGEIEAESVAQAIGELEASGLVVQSIGYASADKGTGPRRAVGAVEKKPLPIVTAVEQAELDRHLARIVERGRSLAPALRAYAAEMSPSRSRRQLLDLLTVLDMGDTPQAVAALQRLPAFWIPLLAAATKSDDPGRMIQVFVRESNPATELSRLWRQTLIYPLVLLCAAAAVMAFLSLIVIPVFRRLFEDFGLRLPALTRVVLAVAEWVSDGRFVVIAAAVAVAAYVLTKFVQWGLPDELRNWLSDRFGKPLGRSTAIAQFSQYLADLLEADFAPASALRLAGSAAESPRLNRAAWRAAGEIDAGGISDIGNRRILTSSVLNAVEADMPSRSRVTLLRELSRCHGERATMLLSWTRGVVEPLAIVLVGFIVGAVVIGLFLPLLSLIQGLS